MEFEEDDLKLQLVECLPPSVDRKSDLVTSLQTFHIKLQVIYGLKQTSAPANYHVQAILFDQKYGSFVGNCWKGRPVQNESSQVIFNQNFYFYTSIPAKDLLLVIELVTPSDVPNRAKSCGWMCLPLLKSDEEESDEGNPIHYKVPLVHGSPISLIPNEEISPKSAKKKKKKKTDPLLKTTSMDISLSQAPFPALLQIAHLFPENVLIDAVIEIPGLMSATSLVASDASHYLKPQLQKCITFLLERLCIRMPSSREEVDKEILEKFQIHQEISTKTIDSKPAKSPMVLPFKGSIVQRNLQIAVHNGYCFIQDPDIYHLHVEPPSTPTFSKSLRRASSMGTLSDRREDSLVIRSDIKLHEVPDNPDVIIVFLVEYVISLPDTKEDRQQMPSSLNKGQTANIAVVWGFCRLGTLKENPSQNINLTCDPSLSPHRVLFLKTSQDFEMTFSAFSLLKQNKNSSTYPSEDHTSDINSSGKSEASTKTSYFRPILSHSTPKHKSVADIPMTVQENEAGYSKGITSKSGSRKNDNNLALQEVTLVSSSLPVVPPLLHSFPLVPGESFKTFTKLYWDKLQPVLDHHGKPAMVIDSSVPYRIDMDLELHCPPQKNECMMQFLAVSGLGEFLEVPVELFFTFQFYRFLPIKSESLCLKPLSGSEDDSYPKTSLVYALHKSLERGKMPGFQVTYNIDPTELNKGEYKSFVQYLMKQTLHVDIWNGQSLLYFGTVALPLKYFCRQGREAVVSNLELDIVNCEYPDESLIQGNIPVKTSLGKLHLQIASIRHPLSAMALEILEGESENSDSVIIRSKVDTSTKDISPVVVSRARRIAETNRELSRLLSNRSIINNSNNMSPDPELTEERRRKLARMEAVRNMENNEKTTYSKGDGMQFFFKERQRDLLSIESYIQKNKSEIIQSFLHSSVTSEKRIYPAIGNKTFFEFVIENPFQVPKKVEMTWKCSELFLVMDNKMWQALRNTHSISQKVEPLVFDDSSQDIPTLLLQPREKVHIPFIYESSSIQTSHFDLFKAVSGHHFTADILSSIPALNSIDSCVKVRFMTEDQTLLAVLNLKIQPLPPSSTHIFKFLSMEHSMFKKSIQINRDGNANGKVTAKCSHPEVVCNIQEAQDLDENINLHIKAPTRSSGKCTEFYIFIYKDKHQIVPIQTWSISVCPLQRIDLSCMAGQLMRSSLLIRGTHATNLVRCSSSSKELQLHPSEPFVLSPFAVQELSMNIRSLMPGIKYFQITMVNQALEQMLQSWLLVLSCQKPSVSKAFQVHLSVGKETAKRITYTNPYHQDRSFVLHSSHPHFLQLREYSFSVAAGESYCMGLYFMPQEFIFTETIFLYLNDAAVDKNEETYCIKIVCQ